MRRSQKIYTVLVILLLLLCTALMVGFFWISRYEIRQTRMIDLSTGAEIAPPAEPDNMSLIDSFLRYTYFEEHSDGSYASYVIYKFENDYCGYVKYTDASGGVYIATNKLPESERARFEKEYSSFEMNADIQSEDSKIKKVAKVYFRGNSGQSTYTVKPLDISNMGLVNPWGEEKPVTVVGLSDDVMKLYDTDVLYSLSECHDDAEFAAYISCLHKQLRVDGKDIKQVDVIGRFDGGYMLSVAMTDGTVMEAKVSTYCYVKINGS